MTGAGDKPALSAAEVGRVFREGSGRAVASLIRVFGDIDVAEDAVQDAFAIALAKWPVDGIPDNPGAWVMVTGRNRAIDRLRRESLGRAILSDVVRERGLEASELEHGLDTLDDDQLRLIFTYCHPSLAGEAQVALTLRLLCGLATGDVARAFLVTESSMAQRIVRAKRKIKQAHIPYRVPEDLELPERLPLVLAVVYLVYNAGLDRISKGPGQGEDLCAEAIRLARLLQKTRPEEYEIAGLLALLLLNESRRTARFAKDGSLVLLRDQDRGLWDQGLIGEGQDLLRACLLRDEAGPYQIQAAIQAVHADAPAIEKTDWAQIVALYDELLHLNRTPVVALNRAIALGELLGPAAGLAAVETLPLGEYYLFHATRGDFLMRMGSIAEAQLAFTRAAALAPTESEETFLRARALE